MKLFDIRVCFLLSVHWLAAEAVVESRIKDLAEKSRILRRFGSSYSSIQALIDRSSLNSSIENATDYEIFLPQSIKRLSTDIKENFNDILTIIRQHDHHEEINIILKFVNVLIDSIVLTFSRIFERPNEIYVTKVNNMMSLLEDIHLSMTEHQPELDDDFLTWIGQLSIKHPYVFCERKTSDQITLFNLVKNLIELELLTFTATKFYYSLHKKLSDNDTALIEDGYWAMLNRSRSYMQTTSNTMKNFSNIIYSCDIKNYVRDENYIELEGLVQPIFISASHLASCSAANMYSDIPSCTELIIVMFHTTYFQESTIDVVCDGKSVDVYAASRNDRPCHGHVSHCVPLKSREVCRNNMYAQPNSLRRYSWYKVNNETFGYEDDCPNGIKEKFEAIEHISKYIRHCHCTCHENGPGSSTTHLLSLAWTLSDIEENKIVTGIKFTRNAKVLGLQIKQGILEREGRILPGSENWKPIANMELLGLHSEYHKTYRNSTFAVLDGDTIFDMDDINASFGYVVTGVRFYKSENQRIKILVQQTKFDWKTGLLNIDTNNVAMNVNQKRSEVPVSLINPSLHQPKIPNMQGSVPNSHYVTLRESSRKIDGGSTTLPFFDAQKVEMEPSAPLSGIGLYYRGSSESAGLISLKLIGLDYSNLMIDSS